MLDSISRLKSLMSEIEGLNASNITPLCGISIAQVSLYLAGKKSPGLEDSEKIDKAIHFIRAVDNAIKPFPCNWKSTGTLLRLQREFDLRGEEIFSSLAQAKTLAPHQEAICKGAA